MGFENMGAPIDWDGYRIKLREQLSKLSQDELAQRLKAREQDLAAYDGMYGRGNQFSNQAEVDLDVLRRMSKG